MLAWNYDLFPSGPEEFGARLRELGFRWGLWCGPFWLCSALEELVERFGDALLKDGDGEPMVARPEWQYGTAGSMPREERPRIYALDPTHPQTLAHLREAFSTYRKWGVRYYMADFLEAGAGNISRYPYAHHHDSSLVAGPEAYCRALREIRRAAGDDTYFLTSTGPSVHNAGFADGMLLGTDMHLLMGEQEIVACAWNGVSRTLSGRAIRPAGETGNLFFHAPSGLRLTTPDRLWIAKDGRDGSLIVRAALCFEEGGADWSVSFTSIEEERSMEERDLA